MYAGCWQEQIDAEEIPTYPAIYTFKLFSLLSTLVLNYIHPVLR